MSFQIMSIHSKEFDCETMAFTIPMEMIKPHEAQAKINHQQTLERLNERGGLSPVEAIAVLEDRPWSRIDAKRAAERLYTMRTNFLERTGKL